MVLEIFCKGIATSPILSEMIDTPPTLPKVSMATRFLSALKCQEIYFSSKEVDLIVMDVHCIKFVCQFGHVWCLNLHTKYGREVMPTIIYQIIPPT
jgi:hypothetical protein